MHHKPEGYTSLAPYLIVKNAEAVMQFAIAVFDAERLRVFSRDDGGIKHAEMRIDDTVLMMGEMPGGPAVHLHVYVPDAHVTFQRALDAGAQQVQPLTDNDDGDLRGGVQSPDGTTWWIAQQIG